MKIKFIGKDPRAGMVAQMDSRRGQELVDAGCAVQVKESEEATSGSATSNDGDSNRNSDEPPAEQPNPPEQPTKGSKKGKGA